MNRDKRFIVELQEDVASGELFIPIPERLLSQLDWYEGIELECIMDGNELILREVN